MTPEVSSWKHGTCYFSFAKIWDGFLLRPALWLTSLSRLRLAFHSGGVCSPPELLSPAAICLKNAYITSCENSFLLGHHSKAALHQMFLSFSTRPELMAKHLHTAQSEWSELCESVCVCVFVERICVYYCIFLLSCHFWGDRVFFL